MALSAIAAAHRAAGHTLDTRARQIRVAMKGIRKTYAAPQAQAEAFVREICTSKLLLPVLGQAIFPYFARTQVDGPLVATILRVKICDAMLALGEPSDEIIKLAREKKVDLIAMTTHGHRLISDILYGATADKVRHAVDVPVLLLKVRN